MIASSDLSHVTSPEQPLYRKDNLASVKKENKGWVGLGVGGLPEIHFR